MMKRTLYYLGIATLLVTMLACKQAASAVSSSTTSATGKEIKIDNFVFTPATITVPVGTEVTWINHDDIPHNVISDDKSIKSKALDTDDKFSFTFTKAGTYMYSCGLHPKMRGTVVVQ